ncbi:histone PARylation factor 1 isoform X1 [Cotesia glomerata]|uniref:PBZ-type domain-containing protein n=1 Tax=Cotesia glomerata TaxID=32391 RepID=A0AAV7J8F9_COTGL|nr:histone PARylation factor 1 isoform X1 [Cotesia glomerata]XP_044584356.1 histone PARylation factor 1 isoform X1 [Cotesia glomerata]KAH0568222.1 hypothetical protein KQX54_019645 [Cotesia glomerata]
MDDNSKNTLEEFNDDPRVTCQYGASCYQKNPKHHEKYKHPPTIQQAQVVEDCAEQGKKRKIDDEYESDESVSSKKFKNNKHNESELVVDKQRISPSPSTSTDDDDFVCDEDDIERIMKEASIQKPIDNSANSDKDLNVGHSGVSSSGINNVVDKKKIILDLFLVEMPDDFYKFYEFCCSLSKDDPQSALRSVDLNLVGPYDVLLDKIKTYSDNDKEKYLRHWRYYYDPPEFQTILKGNDKDGLHYGYWRDESKAQPTFIAKNSANKDYKIIPVAQNIFSAVMAHIEQRQKVANPFEKGKISRVLQTLKNYAKTHDISLEKNSAGMQKRNREVVTKTLHGAGVVVPYNKKTQLGYRQLSLTDSHLIKLLHQIEKADSIDVKVYLGKLEEVVRLATIAADECDFGTPLELGHDLFSCGIEAVQRIALQMLALAYNLLKRPEFLKIAEAHISNRKKGCDLSVL